MTVKTLPSGRTVNIATKYGANHFISDGGGPCTFVSQNIGPVKQACDRIYQRRGRNPTNQEVNDIGLLYTMASELAENADYEVFDQIPVSEIQMYLEHVSVEIDRMTEASSNWARTGALRHYHEQLLIGGLIGLVMHKIPAKLALDMDLFGTLAKFSSAPYPHPCHSLTISSNFITFSIIIIII